MRKKVLHSSKLFGSIAISGTAPHQIKYANLVSNENCGSLTPQWVVGQTLVGKCEAPTVSEQQLQQVCFQK